MPKNMKTIDVYQTLFSTFCPGAEIISLDDGNIKFSIPEDQKIEFFSLLNNPQKLREVFYHAIPSEKNTNYSKLNDFSYSPESTQESIKLFKKIAAEKY